MQICATQILTNTMTTPVLEQEVKKLVEVVTTLKNKSWSEEVEGPVREILEVLFQESEQVLSEISKNVQDSLTDLAIARLAKAFPDSPYYYHYEEQIFNYGQKYNLSPNLYFPRGWFKITFVLPKGLKYRIVFCLFYVKDQNKIAILPFLEHLEKIKYQSKRGHKPKDKEHEIDSEYIAHGLDFDNTPFLVPADADTIRFEVENYKKFYTERISMAIDKIASIISKVISL